MQISKSLALLKIIKYLLRNPFFSFPFLIIRKGYENYTNDDEQFVEIATQND